MSTAYCHEASCQAVTSYSLAGYDLSTLNMNYSLYFATDFASVNRDLQHSADYYRQPENAYSTFSSLTIICLPVLLTELYQVIGRIAGDRDISTPLSSDLHGNAGGLDKGTTRERHLSWLLRLCRRPRHASVQLAGPTALLAAGDDDDVAAATQTEAHLDTCIGS